jgi:hypothetical protein
VDGLVWAALTAPIAVNHVLSGAVIRAHRGRRIRTSAELPHRPGPGPEAEAPAVTELRSAQRRTRRSLAAAVLTPAVLAIVAAVGYYSFAVSHTVLPSDTTSTGSASARPGAT